MSDQRLVLYTDDFWISPYVFTCFVGLHEKSLEFEAHPVALQRKEQLEPGYRDRSITGRVPSLDHAGFRVAESSAIIEYVDEVFPPPRHARLLPEPPKERARARQVMSWLRSDLLALREERPTTTMFYERARAPLSAEGREAAEKLVRVADLLLKDGAVSLFGDWSIADADLGFMLHRLLLNGHDVPPKVRRFAEAQWDRPSVMAFVKRERPPLVPY